jgi:branched-chain amino acid transport system permease protein
MPEADLIANVMITGLLTGMVYGLMALGLSVVFGVIRIVNFAHGELMTAAMYVVVLLSSATQLDPLWLMIPMGVLFFGLGYGLQRTVINRFIQRPEHSQLLLMLAIATILVNGLLMGFGPDAQSVQTDYQLDSFELGPLLIDKARVYAATAAALTALALLAYFRYTTTGKAIRACADNHMGALVTGLPLCRGRRLRANALARCHARGRSGLHALGVRDRDRGRSRLDGGRALWWRADRHVRGPRRSIRRAFGQVDV